MVALLLGRSAGDPDRCIPPRKTQPDPRVQPVLLMRNADDLVLMCEALEISRVTPLTPPISVAQEQHSLGHPAQRRRPENQRIPAHTRTLKCQDQIARKRTSWSRSRQPSRPNQGQLMCPIVTSAMRAGRQGEEEGHQRIPHYELSGP